MGALMDASERLRHAQLHFADDRLRYLVTRATVRTALSHYAALAPSDWVFSSNGYGRPHVVGPDGFAAAPFFNISHTAGLIAVAVGSHGELGIDVEEATAPALALDIAKRFFAPSEAAYFEGMSPARMQQCFIEHWTLKEAFVKARGLGLALPLKQFSFNFPHERVIRLHIDSVLDADAARWHCWQYLTGPKHILALCAAGRTQSAPLIQIRTLTPFKHDPRYCVRLLRSTCSLFGSS